jgi:hypothetical protein
VGEISAAVAAEVHQEVPARISGRDLQLAAVYDLPAASDVPDRHAGSLRTHKGMRAGSLHDPYFVPGRVWGSCNERHFARLLIPVPRGKDLPAPLPKALRPPRLRRPEVFATVVAKTSAGKRLAAESPRPLAALPHLLDGPCSVSS